MNQYIIIFGLASNKIIKKIVIPNKLSEKISLMDFLISNNITIASSCGGDGACKRCVVNNNLLSCQISLSEFIRQNETTIVEISYL